MSDPIDYIDLTVDQPDQPLRLRSKGIKSNAKSRKRNSNKRQAAQLQDSIMYVLNLLNFKFIKFIELRFILEKYQLKIHVKTSSQWKS